MTLLANTSNSQASFRLPNGAISLNRSSVNIFPQWHGSSAHYNDSNIPYLSIFGMIMLRNHSNVTNAIECAIWPCVQALDMTTLSGSQSQTVLWSHSQYRELTVPTTLNAALETHESRYLSLLNHILTIPGSKFNTVPETLYSISGPAVQAIQMELNSTFSGTSYDNSFSNGIRAFIPTNGELSKVRTLLDSLALSMTNHIRLTPALVNSAGQNINPWHQAAYGGQVWTTQGYFRVRWLWVVLPIAVVILSIVFLWLAAIEHWISGTRLWKGSLLPVLFLPLGDGIRDKFTLGSTTKQMQDYAGNVRGGFASI